ncbi:hypothetical protein PUV54_07645 [Hyphococcus flavus]|uniref:Uncharacterized protein n=1 Tax=Hyphococcus flavus TaxID=1866326 RepID=A0AAE9ZI51_9PROT|nr:hypothetical protein [Hyphococcus flavus]WDI33067.1 hypothetical protein PUV54_07645 [Hyphococcus flavus]
MTFSKTLLAGAAVLALVACGKKESDTPASPSSQQAAKVNAASPLEKRFTLADAEPVDIDALFALMPEASRPTYESAAFDDALGATVVSNLRFADGNDGEAVTVERAEFYGVDLEAIERVSSAEEAATDAPFEKIFDKVRFFNMASEGFEEGEEAGKLSIGGLELDQLQIRQGGAKGDGTGDDGARFFNAVNLAGLYFKDMSFEMSSPEAPQVVMSAPDFRIVGLGGGKLNAIIANDLEYTMAQTPESRAAMREVMGPQGAMFLNGPLAGFLAPESQRVKMSSFEWRSIDFSGLLEWGLRDEKPPMTEENLIDLGVMKALDMETYIGGKLAGTVKEASMSAAEFKWLIPSNIRVDTKDASFDYTAYVPDTEEEVLGVMKKHGLDKLKGDGYAQWVWDDRSGMADLDYVANAPGFMNFAVDLGFSGLKLDDMAAAEAAGESPFAATGAFKNFKLTLEDKKALDAIFDVAALQMGGSGADLRQSAPAMIRLSGAQAAQMNPKFSAYVNALADFVGEGGTLEITADPAEPVDFATLQETGTTAPQTMPDLLKLEVTHKK